MSNKFESGSERDVEISEWRIFVEQSLPELQKLIDESSVEGELYLLEPPYNFLEFRDGAVYRNIFWSFKGEGESKDRAIEKLQEILKEREEYSRNEEVLEQKKALKQKKAKEAELLILENLPLMAQKLNEVDSALISSLKEAREVLKNYEETKPHNPGYLKSEQIPSDNDWEFNEYPGQHSFKITTRYNWDGKSGVYQEAYLTKHRGMERSGWSSDERRPEYRSIGTDKRVYSHLIDGDDVLALEFKFNRSTFEREEEEWKKPKNKLMANIDNIINQIMQVVASRVGLEDFSELAKEEHKNMLKKSIIEYVK